MRSALLVLFAVAAGCKAPLPQQPPPPTTMPASHPIVSMIDVADPEVEAQLVNGFHEIEWGNGRWTKQSFGANLKAPRTGRERGATLRVKLDLPKDLIDQEKSVSFACTVGGQGQTAEKWDTPGAHVYSREIAFLATDSVVVSCKADKKYVPPGDGRELGVVLHAIGLEPN